MRANCLQRADQVGHADVFAHCQPFHLVELVLGAGGDLLVAIALAGQDHADRLRAALAHRADLAGAGVRAHHQRPLGRVGIRVLADPERVPHVARRVIGRDVEQAEVVLVRLHVGRVVDLEAHLGEDGVDLAQGLRGDVQVAQRSAAGPAA